MTDALFLVETGALVVLSAVLLYLVVAYARNVMHRTAVVLLAATLLIYTASAIVEHVFGLPVVGEAIHLASDLTFLGAFWLFAREFIATDTARFEPAESAPEGGFDADDD